MAQSDRGGSRGGISSSTPPKGLKRSCIAVPMFLEGILGTCAARPSQRARSVPASDASWGWLGLTISGTVRTREVWVSVRNLRGWRAGTGLDTQQRCCTRPSRWAYITPCCWPLGPPGRVLLPTTIYWVWVPCPPWLASAAVGVDVQSHCADSHCAFVLLGDQSDERRSETPQPAR